MKTKKFCGSQAARLASKRFFPSTEAGATELADVLFEHVASDDHAKRVIDKAVLAYFGDPDRPEDRCPGPAELAELCSEVSPVVMQEAKVECEFCGGCGFELAGIGVRRCRCGGYPQRSVEFGATGLSGESEERGSGNVSTDAEMRELVMAVSERRKLL